MSNILVYTDMSMRENWLGLGYVIYHINNVQERELCELGARAIDTTQFDYEYTTNMGEYRSIITGVRAALDYDCENIVICNDNQPVVDGINEERRFADDGYFHHALYSFLGRFSEWRVRHVDRDRNNVAHQQARSASEAAQYAES